MKHIYLDHAAATPMRPEVREAMARVETGIPGNPSSPHAVGRAARAALEGAREGTAELLGCAPGRVRFVRGGTEANNLAILGRFYAVSDARDAARMEDPDPGPTGVGISALEHSAVREAAGAVARRGGRVTVLPVRPDGTIPEQPLAELLARSPAVVSIQQVNPDTGLVLDLERPLAEARAAGVPFHVDAVQAVGRVPLPSADGGPQMLTLAGHKIGGPRSTGVLVIDDGVEIAPLVYGGGQERGLRSGTEDVAGAVGFAAALRLALGGGGNGAGESGEGAGGTAEVARLGALRDALEHRIAAALPEIRIFGVEGRRAPHILSLGVPGLPRDLLPGVLDLEGVCVSAGSACRSGSSGPSPVLEALYGEEAARSALLRISLGWTTTPDEIEEAGERIVRTLERVLPRSAAVSAP